MSTVIYAPIQEVLVDATKGVSVSSTDLIQWCGTPPNCVLSDTKALTCRRIDGRRVIWYLLRTERYLCIFNGTKERWTRYRQVCVTSSSLLVPGPLSAAVAIFISPVLGLTSGQTEGSAANSISGDLLISDVWGLIGKVTKLSVDVEAVFGTNGDGVMRSAQFCNYCLHKNISEIAREGST